MTDYQRITIYTCESAEWDGQQPGAFVGRYLKQKGLRARSLSWHAQGGYFEDGEAVGSHIEVMAARLPVKIEIVLEAGLAQEVLHDLRAVMQDALVVLEPLPVVGAYLRTPAADAPTIEGVERAGGTAPRLGMEQMQTVAQTMTRAVCSVQTDTPLAEVVELLLRADFHGVPVTDEFGIVKGIITQRDLINRGGMPVRLGLLARLRAEGTPVCAKHLLAADAMTIEPVTVLETDKTAHAVRLMLRHALKRLPVVNQHNKLCGMLCRIDVLRAAVQCGTHAVQDDSAPVAAAARTARDAARATVATCGPEASFAEILQTLDAHQMQRVAVVDVAGKLLGLIFDHDLLPAFDAEGDTILRHFINRVWRGRSAGTELASKRARELMVSDVATVAADLPLPQVLQQMVEQGFKRLPVVDDEGRFLGMLSRDMLLRALCY